MHYCDLELRYRDLIICGSSLLIVRFDLTRIMQPSSTTGRSVSSWNIVSCQPHKVTLGWITHSETGRQTEYRQTFRQTDGQRQRERVAPKLIKKVEFIWRLSQIRNIYNYWHIKAETDLYKDREEKVLEIGSVKMNFDMYFFIPFRKNVGATHE